MDEYGGYFRLVTSDTDRKVTREGGSVSAEILGETQTLYVLDENLRIVGTYSNVSKDERLQSVRFVENTAYSVSYTHLGTSRASIFSRETKKRP